MRCLSERSFGGHLGNGPDLPLPWVLCSFSCADKKTNQKKPPVPRGPSGCPVLLAAGGPWGTRLRSNSHRAFIAGCCDARPEATGHKTSPASGDLNPAVVFGKRHTCRDWRLSSLERPISALRRISKSLRRTVVRLTPRDLRAATWPFYETVWILNFYRFIMVGPTV